MSRVVLVTGAANIESAIFARHLSDRGADAGIRRVVAVDTTLPTTDLGGAKFIRADIRTPVIGKVLAVEDVDTVVHLGPSPARKATGSTKELNVIGTMQLLAACQRSEHLKKFVLGSSTAVYGTSPRDPAVWRESGTARGGAKTGYPREVVEVESYTRGFARRRPDVTVTTLRFSQVLARGSQAPLARYFRAPALPSVLGFDPRLQFLHFDDALNVLTRAAIEDKPGTYNVAGEGIIMLSQAARLLGKPTIPLPPVGVGALIRSTMRAMGSDVSPGLERVLTYGGAVDTSALRTKFGYTPVHSTRDTFDEFATTLRPGILHLGGMPR